MRRTTKAHVWTDRSLWLARLSTLTPEDVLEAITFGVITVGAILVGFIVMGTLLVVAFNVTLSLVWLGLLLALPVFVYLAFKVPVPAKDVSADDFEPPRF